VRIPPSSTPAAPPAPQQVGHPPTEQKETAEREDVRVHDPREVLLREVEPLADRGQGDVDDRGIEDDDELREAEENEGDPASALVFLGCGHVGVLLWSSLLWLLSCV
jgi:hypothetical protein